MLALVLAVTTGFTTFTLVSAAWGYVASWVNQILKQDGFPKSVNAVIAAVVLAVSAALATLTETSFNWHNFASALFAAAGAALINHQFVLTPTGIGQLLKTKTSIIKGPQPPQP